METTSTPVVETKKISGSKHIVAVLKEKGLETPANDVIAALAAKGVTVTVPLVNNVKFHMRKKKDEKKAARRERVKQPVPATPATSPVQSEFDQMVALKKIVAEVGGFEKLALLVDKLKLLAS
jgi:hypothetical protein